MRESVELSFEVFDVIRKSSQEAVNDGWRGWALLFIWSVI